LATRSCAYLCSCVAEIQGWKRLTLAQSTTAELQWRKQAFRWNAVRSRGATALAIFSRASTGAFQSIARARRNNMHPRIQMSGISAAANGLSTRPIVAFPCATDSWIPAGVGGTVQSAAGYTWVRRVQTAGGDVYPYSLDRSGGGASPRGVTRRRIRHWDVGLG
jgi:hypothetical protein